MHIDLLRCTRYATYAFFVAVPGLVESLPLMGMHDNARALQVVLCCLALSAWALHFDPRSYRWSPIQTALVGLALTLTVISIWQAKWPLFAATEACLWVGLIALAWVFARSSINELTQEIPGVVAVAILLMGLQELMDIGFAWLSSHPLDVVTVGRGHANRRHFNHVQTVALVLAMLPIWYGQTRWIRWSAWCGLAVGFAMVWFTGARSTLVATSLVAMGVLVFANQNRILWLRRLLLMSAVSAIIFHIFYALLPALLGIEVLMENSISGRENAGSVQSRLIHWQRALEMAIERPLTGWGGLHYATQLQVDAAHPHNIILQWAAEWGWVSALLALCALGWWTRNRWVAMWHSLCGASWAHSPVATTAWLATLAGWLDAMLSGTLTMPVSQVWWCCCLGIAQSSENMTPQNHTPKGNSNYIYSKILALTLIAGLLYMLEKTHQTAQTFTHSATGQPLEKKPRLWLFGTLP